jgi:hypothetical protein
MNYNMPNWGKRTRFHDTVVDYCLEINYPYYELIIDYPNMVVQEKSLTVINKV